jgi:hypothetical protein
MMMRTRFENMEYRVKCDGRELGEAIYCMMVESCELQGSELGSSRKRGRLQFLQTLRLGCSGSSRSNNVKQNFLLGFFGVPNPMVPLAKLWL